MCFVEKCFVSRVDVIFYIDWIYVLCDTSSIDRYFCLFMFGRTSQNIKGFAIFRLIWFRNVTVHAFYCTYPNARLVYDAFLSELSITKNVRQCSLSKPWCYQVLNLKIFVGWYLSADTIILFNKMYSYKMSFFS